MTLEQAIARVRAEAGYVGGGPRTVALKAFLFVHGFVSPELYLLKKDAGEALPMTTGKVLETQAGLCGNQCQAFCDIVRPLGVEARQWGFWFDSEDGRESHVVAEAKWDGEWHAFDVYWGIYWQAGDLICSLDQAASGKGSPVVDQPYLTASRPVAVDGRDPLRFLRTTRERWILGRDGPDGRWLPA